MTSATRPPAFTGPAGDEARAWVTDEGALAAEDAGQSLHFRPRKHKAPTRRNASQLGSPACTHGSCAAEPCSEPRVGGGPVWPLMGLVEIGSTQFALFRKLKGAGVHPGFALIEKVILTVAFSTETFLIRMDLAVRKARGHQK